METYNESKCTYTMKVSPDGTTVGEKQYTNKTYTRDNRFIGEHQYLLHTNDYLQEHPHRLRENRTGNDDITPKKLMGYFPFILLVLVIPSGMFYVGIRDWNACPVQPMIPAFLVFSGLTFILIACFLPFVECCTVYVIICILIPFYIAWQITGSVYAFKEFSDWQKNGGCRGSTYEFAFAMVIIFWVLVLLIYSYIAYLCHGIIVNK